MLIAGDDFATHVARHGRAVGTSHLVALCHDIDVYM